MHVYVAHPVYVFQTFGTRQAGVRQCCQHHQTSLQALQQCVPCLLMVYRVSMYVGLGLLPAGT